MLGRSHYVIGSAAGLWWLHLLRLPAGFAAALAETRLPFGGHVPHLLALFGSEVIAFAFAVSIGGIAALLPDADEPNSLVGRFLPPVWHAWTPGHRGCTHSLLATAIWSGFTFVVWYVVFLTGAATHPESAPAIAEAANGVARELSSLVAVCYASHLLADSVTDHGVRWFYLPPWIVRMLPRAAQALTQVKLRIPYLAYKTGEWPERVWVTAAVVAAAWYAYDLQAIAHHLWAVVPA